MSEAFPIRYVDPVFRPPSEAQSLILPVTDGCSWNHCTFCEMYTEPQKRFRARDEHEVLESIRRCGERFGSGSPPVCSNIGPNLQGLMLTVAPFRLAISANSALPR